MPNSWSERSSQVAQQFRQARDNARAMQRVQVTGAVDRWIQDSVRTAVNSGGGAIREVAPATEVWERSAATSTPQLELSLAQVLEPRQRHQLVTTLHKSFVTVSQEKTAEAKRNKPTVAWDVVIPSLLSLAAGIGLVRAIVVVMDYAGAPIHGWWWLAVAFLVGILFTTGMVALRVHQRREKLRMTMAAELHRELGRRVQEIVAALYFAETADKQQYAGRQSSQKATLGMDIYLGEGHTTSLTPRRVAVACNGNS
ncbi:MAG: hypothetical protein WAN89_05115 [Lawsonella sp.]